MAKGLDKAKISFRAEESLTRLPRGFEAVADPAIAAAVMRKSHIGSRPIAPARLASPDLVDDLVLFAKQTLPLLQWGWEAVIDER